MYLRHLLKERCVSELLESISEDFPDSREHIESAIRGHLGLFDGIGEVPSLHPQRCCARIWKTKTGVQCGRRRHEGDYCTQHAKEISERGYLQFRRYDEEKPIINEAGDVLPWYEGYASIDVLFRYQRMNLHKLLKHGDVTPQ